MKKSSVVLLIFDIAAIPVLFLLEKLSDLMLSQPKECPMVTLGGKCVTCGGTHFVNSLLNFRLGEAFSHNQFLFVLSVFLLISFVLLNLYLLFGFKRVKTVLQKLYSIPSLVIWLSAMLIFFFVRNIPLLELIIKQIL